LQPKYLLESCQDLQRLSIEWQHELSQPPHDQFHPQWFTTMLNAKEWPELASKLSHLVNFRLTELVILFDRTSNESRKTTLFFQAVKFPSADSPLGYSLPLSDFGRLLANTQFLVSLKLVSFYNHQLC
jgi:hypothetical protein